MRVHVCETCVRHPTDNGRHNDRRPSVCVVRLLACLHVWVGVRLHAPNTYLRQSVYMRIHACVHVPFYPDALIFLLSALLVAWKTALIGATLRLDPHDSHWTKYKRVTESLVKVVSALRHI